MEREEKSKNMTEERAMGGKASFTMLRIQQQHTLYTMNDVIEYNLPTLLWIGRASGIKYHAAFAQISRCGAFLK